MKKFIFILFLIITSIGLVGCKETLQHSKPEIIVVESSEEIPTDVRPVFLRAPDASGLYYMEIIYKGIVIKPTSL